MSFLRLRRKFVGGTAAPGTSLLSHQGRNTAIIITDDVPPSVPTGLAATAISTSRIDLSWNASTDTGGSGLAGYRLYRDGGGTPIVDQSTRTFSDTGLAESTTYNYRVSAYDVQGNESAQSSQVNATTQAGVTDPYALRAPLSSDKFMDPNATDGSGTEASPWRSLTSARANTLAPGQVLWIKNGNITDWPSLLSLPSGTAQNRIKIAAYPGHTPTITFPSAGLTSLDGYPGFGSPSGTQYWDIHGLNFEVPGMCGLMFGIHQWNLTEVNCSNVRVIDCTGHTSVATSDNAGILFFDGGSNFIEVVRCNFTSAGASGGDGKGNRALIWTDFSTHFSLIGCILDAAGVSLPFYHKHSNFQAAGTTQRIIKNNIIMNGSRGMLFCGRYFQLTNNVFRNVNLDFADQGGFDVGRGLNTLRHNTFYITVGNNFSIEFVNNNGGAASGENFDNTFIDNVVTQTGFLWDGATSGVDIRTISRNNLYDTGGSEIRRVNTFYSLSGYKAAFPDREINSVAGSVTFVGGGSQTTTPAQWELTGAGRNAASDGTDIGVDVTKLLTVD